MPIELTEPQQQALDLGDEIPPRVIDPRTHAAYVLVPAEDYESIRDALEEDRRGRLIRAVGRSNAAGRMAEEPHRT